MRRTHLFTVHDLQQGWLETWALTSRNLPTARAIELRVVRRLLRGGGDEDADRAGPIALYRDAGRVPWSIATHAVVVNASGRAAARALLLHLTRCLGVLEGGLVARAVLQRVFASDGLRG